MANVGDKVTFHHGKKDNRFHEDKDSHPAEVLEVLEDNKVRLTILNAEGQGTIPINNVPHKADKSRDKTAAYWE